AASRNVPILALEPARRRQASASRLSAVREPIITSWPSSVKPVANVWPTIPVPKTPNRIAVPPFAWVMSPPYKGRSAVHKPLTDRARELRDVVRMTRRDEIPVDDHRLIVTPDAAVLLHDRANHQLRVFLREMEARQVAPLRDPRARDQQRPSTDRRDQFPGLADTPQEGKHVVVLRENRRALRTTGNQHPGIVERIRIADRPVDVEHADTRKIRIDLEGLRIERDDLGPRTSPLELVLRQEVL